MNNFLNDKKIGIALILCAIVSNITLGGQKTVIDKDKIQLFQQQGVLEYRVENNILGSLLTIGFGVTGIGFFGSAILKDKRPASKTNVLIPTVPKPVPLLESPNVITNDRPDNLFPDLDIKPEPKAIHSVIRDQQIIDDFIDQPIENDTQSLIPEGDLDFFKTKYNKGHIFFSCSSDTGKTSSILSLIKETSQNKKFKKTHYIVFDPKHSRWLGLENTESPIDGVNCVNHLDMSRDDWGKEYARKLKKIQKYLVQKQKDRNKGVPNKERIILIIDEWMSTNLLLSRTDSKSLDVIKSLLDSFVGFGLEDNLNVWLVSQTFKVEANGFRAGIRDLYFYWCQGREDKIQPIEEALTSSYFIKSDSYASKFKNDFEKGYPSDESRPVVLTNVGGAKMFIMPDNEGIKEEIFFNSSSNPDVEHLENVIPFKSKIS